MARTAATAPAMRAMRFMICSLRFDRLLIERMTRAAPRRSQARRFECQRRDTPKLGKRRESEVTPKGGYGPPDHTNNREAHDRFRTGTRTKQGQAWSTTARLAVKGS